MKFTTDNQQQFPVVQQAEYTFDCKKKKCCKKYKKNGVNCKKCPKI